MELWIRSQDKENTVKIINKYGLKYNDKKTKFSRVILKGIDNINTYAKNNHLKRVEEMFRDLYEN